MVMDAFEDDCKNATNGLDLMNIAETYHQMLTHSYDGCGCQVKDCVNCLVDSSMNSGQIKNIYNNYIGWALPSRKACQLVVDEWQKDPSRNIVDLGAGTGVFCKVFNDLGVSSDKLITVDLENPTHISAFGDTKSIKRREFWPVIRNNYYQPNPEDIVFIAWGTTGIDNIIDDYVKRGGKCIIILGETNVTYDPEKFIDQEDWMVKLHHVPGPLSIYAEQLSINKNIHDQKVSLLWILVEKYKTYMGY
jgi:hypothetical protein